MNIHYHNQFVKHYKERIVPNSQLVDRFKQRLRIFIADSTDTQLRDHQLLGKKSEYRAFSVTPDIRVVYKRVVDGILLYDIGTHKQVY